ncbi:TRAP transporter substrate-binding protein [Hydrogenophaga sp. 5NK40-0174]|uniref:TRAP transporter substrate-binding protein n=1 Tax=Hydrogenophaga sp. 5NK40-0174 TaxID=3127649 RepID=UPI003109D46A
MFSWKRTLGTMALAASASLTAQAQEVTLRFHQFLPPQATIPSKAIAPWAKKVEEDSKGRIKIQMFGAMQLGGTPPQLYDQARDGVVDIIWTLPGYTPGRFNKVEAFELPFMASLSAEQTSKSFYEYVQKNAMDEFKDVHVLTVHVHGPGLFHTKKPVTGLDSLKGMKIRGGTRIVNNMLTKLGATPVGMPVPAVTEALSKGVLDGTTIPWEVGPALKVPELVHNHTTFAGDRALYVTTFVVAMNKAKYESLPADLKKVLDDNSGAGMASLFGKAMDEGDVRGKAMAEKNGNNVVALDEAETAKFRETAASVEADWVKEMQGKGIDGASLVKQARALVQQNSK